VDEEPHSEEQSDTLTTEIESEGHYRLGARIVLTFVLRNQSSETYALLTWGTPFEGTLTGDCLDVQRDHEVVAYDGVLVKRGDPPPGAYLLISPGEERREPVDISTAYAIDRPGAYTVTLDATAPDAFTVPQGAKPGPRTRRDFQPLTLPSATVHFDVGDGGAPRPTAGQVVRASEEQPKTGARAPVFKGGTVAERADAVVAHNDAQSYAALAADQLNAAAAGGDLRYPTWFGAFDQGRYDAVMSHFTDIARILVTVQVTYDFTRVSPAGYSCRPGDFAFTYRNARTVWLCGGFLAAPQKGTDCKFGTLVHEWSHAISHTEDTAYGETECRRLATSDPGGASNNADSHEYFAEGAASVTPRPDLRPDDVARGVAGSAAVTLVGYLDVGEGDAWQLWNTYFQARLELRRDQILYQMAGNDRPDGRSIIWVRRDARVAKCEFGTAADFAGEFAESEEDDGADRPEGPNLKRHPKY